MGLQVEIVSIIWNINFLSGPDIEPSRKYEFGSSAKFPVLSHLQTVPIYDFDVGTKASLSITTIFAAIISNVNIKNGQAMLTWRLWRLLRNGSLSENFICYFKPLLEQGNPINKSLWDNRHLADVSCVYFC